MTNACFLCLLTFLVVATTSVWGDSPITSTPFASAYSNEKIIMETAKANGLITTNLIEYLSKQGNPIELKMAVINQLGWQMKIKDNASQFFRALSTKRRYKSEEDFKERGSGDELLAMAYLLAMDDYQEVAPAVRYADLALEKSPQSLTYNLIVGLIRAQKAMENDWCDVYKITNQVRQNTALTVDMKETATQIIYEYTDGYREFCK